MRNIALKILGINILVFILQATIPGFTQQFYFIWEDMLTRPWIIITSMFMHAHIYHILFNMYVLLLFGPLLEQKIGSKRFLYFYLLSGILAAIGYGIFNPSTPALGASGALMGVIGMIIMLLPHLKILFFFVIPVSMRTAGILFAAIDILGLFNQNSGVANLAHLVGLGAGLLFGKYLLSKKSTFQKNFVRKKQANSTNPQDVVIELNENDVNEYLKNGRL